jgi:hypothetical protein
MFAQPHHSLQAESLMHGHRPLATHCGGSRGTPSEPPVSTHWRPSFPSTATTAHAPFATFAAALGSNGSSPPIHVLMLIIWQRLTDSIIPGRRHGPGRFEQFCALQKGDQRHHSVLRSHENQPTSVGWGHGYVGRAVRPTAASAEPKRRATYFLGFSLQPETKAEMTSCPLRL